MHPNPEGFVNVAVGFNPPGNSGVRCYPPTLASGAAPPFAGGTVPPGDVPSGVTPGVVAGGVGGAGLILGVIGIDLETVLFALSVAVMVNVTGVVLENVTSV